MALISSETNFWKAKCIFFGVAGKCLLHPTNFVEREK